jgi:hypothetical protein
MIDLADRLDEALAASSPWDPLVTLAAEAGEALIPVLRTRYPANPSRVAWILRAIPGGAQLAVELLHGSSGAKANDLLRVISVRDTPCPEPELRRLLTDETTRAMAVAVAGMSGHRGLVPELVPLLDNPDVCAAAAIALGMLGVTGHTADLVRRLPSLDPLKHQAFIVGLEQLGDVTAVEGLRDWLAEAPDRVVFDLHHALVRLTGRDPLVPLSTGLADWAANVRTTWRTASWPVEPTLSGLRLDGPAGATFALDQGRGAITTDYDPPIPGSAWPRWDKTIHALGHRLYQAGSDCGTCEAFLSHLGWPPERAIPAADRLRTALTDVPVLTDDLLAAMAPMLEGLRTGHYQVRLADLDIEYVADPGTSWLVRRQEFRDQTEVPPSAGTDHFQLRSPMPDPTPSFGVFLPTQPLDALDQATIDAHRRAIEDGARPGAVLLTWVEDRYVEAEYEERMVFGLVLDGHHKLTAYAEAGVPARAALVYRIEDTAVAVLDQLTWP